ncbi:hypothetical protein AWE51_13065 [Aquimarina aggregata]|uniref:Lipoprotein n=1 Tax=Aquimarina aggregata TaxID=1642818 RepID=A0A162YZV0_9FLAO|nr:hypothetical protein [Aquimarina aggregata]KZS39460.1 hypothetical protein AWE51_13065 [Aquimarina aggregata]
MGSFRMLTLAIFCFLISCNTNTDKFKIDNDLIDKAKSNNNCLDILETYYNIDSKKIEETKYFETLLSRYIDLNENKKYTRFLFLKLEVVGEVMESLTFSIGEYSNGELEIVKYFAEDDEIKTQKKVLKNQTINNLYNFFEKDSPQYSVGKILILDFSFANSKCGFYNYLSSKDIKKIKELAFFEP